MKKILVFVTIIILLFCFLSLVACQKSDVSSAIYKNEITSNGKVYQYSLIVDYDTKDYLMKITSDTQNTYSGSFVEENGYLKLTHGEKTEYVKIIGDNFSFFSPSPDNNEKCNHEFEVESTFTGNCSNRSYVMYRCKKCSDTKYEYGGYGDHGYVFSSYKEGDCKNYGVTLYECRYCGQKKEKKDETYGNHKFGNEFTVDSGCLSHTTITRRCSVCDKTESVETKNYGAHRYNASGECVSCHYYDNGLYSTHTDSDGDGLCDVCYKSTEVLNALITDGYCLKGNTFYYGVYPQKVSPIPAEDIEKNGKYDSYTGYYRYKNESYAIITDKSVASVSFSNGTKPEKNKKYAFLVEPVEWQIIADNEGNISVMTRVILDTAEFLSASKIRESQNIFYHVDDEISIKDEVLANDYSYSDIRKFIKNSIQSKIFSKKALSATIFEVASLDEIKSTFYKVNAPVTTPSGETENIKLNRCPCIYLSDYAVSRGVQGIRLSDSNYGFVMTSSKSETSNKIYVFSPDDVNKSDSKNYSEAFVNAKNYGFCLYAELSIPSDGNGSV